jgi:hypothetical protein
MATREVGLAEPATIRTHTGRQVTVGRFLLDEVAPIGRVVLRVSCQRTERDQLWASLTAEEARRLAEDLLARAAEVEHRCTRR